MVSLSFQRTEREIFMDLDRLLKWFCRQVGRRLKQLQQLNWDSNSGSKGNCSDYFEDYLLAELDCPLVLGLDEVDRIFPYRSVVDDFFGLLRAWYDEARSGNYYADELCKYSTKSIM
ncbi:MAG: AAA-like domain-containing protein [Spirulina sp.]